MKRELGVAGLWCTGAQGQSYVPLGPRLGVQLSERDRDRIQGASRAVDAVWGTLGPWNDAYDAKQRWFGELSFSELGNDYSTPEESGLDTCQLISDVRETRLEQYNQCDRHNVRERYIDLSHLQVRAAAETFTLDAEEAARLTLFVGPGEGALVFLQHGRDAEGGVTLLQPEKVPNFDASARDRLTYRVPLWSYMSVVHAEQRDSEIRVTLQDGATGHPAGTSLKILTFERGDTVSSEVLRRAARALDADRVRLLLWDTSRQSFLEADAAAISRQAKSLLLLHGTFSSTRGSFGKLTSGGREAWVQKVLDAGRYGQVLAFDHGTVFDSLEENAQQLRALCGGAFVRPLDVVTQSRGGLLAKHLAIYEPGFEIERAALVACANGVGYFRAGHHVARLLTVLRHLVWLGGSAKWAVALAQHSAEFVLALEGLKPMHPGSSELARVATVTVPESRAPTVFRPVVGDWDRSIIQADDEGRRALRRARWRRWGAAGLDLILQSVLGSEHDWVVGTKEQRIVAPGHLAPGVLHGPPIPALHTGYYSRGIAQNAIARFLNTGRGD